MAAGPPHTSVLVIPFLFFTLLYLHLFEQCRQLPAHVQLSGVKHQEDEVSTVNEPLTHLAIGVAWMGKDDQSEAVLLKGVVVYSELSLFIIPFL